MSVNAVPKVVRLQCEPNNYEWGPIGFDSLFARLTPNASAAGYIVDPKKPYAELWMGTHPKSPARLYGKDTPLSEWLTQHPEVLGDAKDRFDPPFSQEQKDEVGSGHVPFLFKILCCKQALPLQIHPNKELADKFHRENPEQFPDKNHKPEIAVCLSDRFLGFAAFRPISQIQQLIKATPEIQKLPAAVTKAIKSLLEHQGESNEESANLVKSAWRAILEAEGPEVENMVIGYTTRAAKEGLEALRDVPDEVASQRDKMNMLEAVAVLDEYNHGDATIFASLLFLNLVELQQGDGMYVGADGPHAWLRGAIVELMAVSDNVLNVGFTPEKDSVALTTQAVSGTPKTAEEIKLKKALFKKGRLGKTDLYKTPFEEFAIMHTSVPEAIKPLSGPTIAIVSKGEMTLWDRDDHSNPIEGAQGTVYFVAAGTNLGIRGDGEVWMAFYDSDKEAEDQIGPS